MNRKANIWAIAAAALVLVALAIEGLTIQRIGVGPLSIDFAPRGDGPHAGTQQNQGPGSGTDAGTNGGSGNGQESRVSVPALVGQTKQAAADALTAANLQASYLSVDGDAPVDEVVRSNPAAGATVAPHSVVQVELSRGPFAGTWVNEDPSTRSVPQVMIETITASTATLHVWGACTPTWCDWGTTTASSSDGELRASYNPGFAVKQLTISRSGGQLVVRIRTHFTDNSGRADYVSTDTMNRK